MSDQKSNYLKLINIYCDESRYTNPFEQYFLIGALFCPREKKPKIHNHLKKIKRKFGFMPEMKWGNVTEAKLPYLEQILQVFFTNDINFRCIIIDKSKLKLNKNKQVEELPFYKFYYLLLKGIFEPNIGYYIFLDERTKSEKKRIGDLQKYLKNYLTKLNQVDFEIDYLKQIQEVKSEQSLFIQVTDLFMGAVGYYWNGFRGSKAKMAFIQSLLNYLHKKNLKFSSQLYDKKWNQFVWQPNNSFI